MTVPTLPLSSLPYLSPTSPTSPSSSGPSDPHLLTQRQVEAFINLLSTALARDQAEELHRQRLGVISDWATPRRADQSGLTLMRKMREFEGLAGAGRITGEQMAKLRRLNTLFRPRAYQLLAVSHDRKVRVERQRYQTQEKASQVARYYQQQQERQAREREQQEQGKRVQAQQRQLQAMLVYGGQPLAQGGSRTRFNSSTSLPSPVQQQQQQQGPTSMDVLSELFLRPPGSSPGSSNSSHGATPTLGTPAPYQNQNPPSMSSNGSIFFPSPSPPSSSSDAPSPATPPSYAHAHAPHSSYPSFAGQGPISPAVIMSQSQSQSAIAPSAAAAAGFPMQLQMQLDDPTLAVFPDMNPDGTIGEEWWNDPSLMEAMCKLPPAAPAGAPMPNSTAGTADEGSPFDFSSYVSFPEDE
ncbi:hypothetical protein CALVIDRAFT_567232 [Calocera viscosa TUFC12733]|uniref:Uncharacterized protein n=1 Tax=Calocera viscosa (strain TUFC12733) TaxID=1330018 RepID=A0A167IDW5_CALVF|nr:hypothetical protein CALVIDRAFT_567232 [Calocera viscosa TUFC12733]